MNKFITICLSLSFLSLLVMFTQWVTKPSPATVVLSSEEWMCVESVPKGLNAECTVYNRVATKKVVK